MLHNKNTEFVMYVDNFLTQETLESLQETFLKISYSQVKNPEGQVYGQDIHFHIVFIAILY